MSDDKKKVIVEETAKKNEKKEIPEEQLGEVTGGGAFSNVPRVPEKPIDDKLRDNI